ncbi:MAG TPA: sugar phosphate isomerase/epimerase [Bacteroides sp.]|nr:sugar phosphate isomerase/epimerase [Bacteroides sp.]
MTNRPWSLKECVTRYHRAGVRGISVWRNLLERMDLHEARMILDDHGMEVVSLVRGGFFASADSVRRKLAIEDNMVALEQAAMIGAPLLVLVCGADERQSLVDSRAQIREGIEKLLPHAEGAGVKLAIEPMHPMYAADRSAINTLAQANHMAESFQSDHVGVAVDVFHLWWDPDLHGEIIRCGKNGNLSAFHICDWKASMDDMLNDRGLMGEGAIPLKEIRGWVEETGFEGYLEVEIFSERYWSMDQAAYLDRIIDAYRKHT